MLTNEIKAMKKTYLENAVKFAREQLDKTNLPGCVKIIIIETTERTAVEILNAVPENKVAEFIELNNYGIPVYVDVFNNLFKEKIEKFMAENNLNFDEIIKKNIEHQAFLIDQYFAERKSA